MDTIIFIRQKQCGIVDGESQSGPKNEVLLTYAK